MDANTWASEKSTYEQDIMSYSGPDPLKPRYEYVVWLEKNMGEGEREGAAAEGALMPVLENTLAMYKEERRYTQDPRFAHLLVLYVKRQNRPLEVYDSLYRQGGVGTRCSVLYVSWAELAERSGQLTTAYAVYERGLAADAQPSQSLAQSYREFLMRVGTKYLKGELKEVSPKQAEERLCSRCKGPLIEGAEGEPVGGCHVKSWELRSLRVGDVDDFSCPLAYFEPTDPTKKPMYPKSRVYVGNKEYQLEELIAEEYLQEFVKKKTGPSKSTTVALSAPINAHSANGVGSLADRELVGRATKRESRENENQNPTNTGSTQAKLQPSAQQPAQHLPPHLSKEVEQNSLWGQSMTINMKEALNVVQDMWNSPAPAVRKLPKPATEPHEPLPDNIINAPVQGGLADGDAVVKVKEEGSESKKKLPFQVFTEPSTLDEDELVIPPQVLGLPPPQPVTATKPPSIQFDVYSDENESQRNTKADQVKSASTVKKVNPATKYGGNQSERKPLVQQEKLMDAEPQTGGGGARQLIFKEHFENEPLAKNNIEEMRSEPIQPQPKHQIRQEWEEKPDEDMTDVTCNTKAFAFMLPSSTPLQSQAARSKARSSAAFDSNGSYIATAQEAENNTGLKSNIVHHQQPAGPNHQQQIHQQAGAPPASGGGPGLRHPQELSMILEASNSSSGGGSGGTTGLGGSTVKTPSSQLVLTKTPGTASSVAKNLEDNLQNLLLDDAGEVDPFSSKLINSLLARMKFPQAHSLKNYHCFNASVPSLGKTVKIGSETFNVHGEIGKGNYARVVKASCGSRTIALKVEKPACIWEYYICEEVKKRIPSDKVSLFMDVKAAYIFQNGSLLETEWAKYGSLLNIVNQVKIQTRKPLDMLISSYLTVQIVDTIDYLHRGNIIHGDIKPDNFVLREMPTVERMSEPCIQLIDFGRSIDMKLLPPSTTFTVAVTTDCFQCNEMKEKRPWTYQTDLYGLAGTVYCLLVGEYMKVVKKKDVWVLQKSLPRYFNRDIWDPFFHSLLNIESCAALPTLSILKAPIEKVVQSSNNTFRLSQLFQALANTLDNK